MLTHTIRALSLLALLTVAHALRPFSSNNVAVFTANAFASVTNLLPEKARESWQAYGSLVAVVTGNPTPLAMRFADASSASKIDLALVRAGQAASGRPARLTEVLNQVGRTGRRAEQSVAFQPRRQSRFDKVPLPFIPALESSFISNPSLLAFPSMINADGIELPHPSLGVFGLQQQFNNFERNDESVSEASVWVWEPILHKPLPSSPFNFPAKTTAPLQRASNASQACPQPNKGTKGIVSIKGQSC
ncbi:MAG: hypothetical protein HYR56_12780 [Acidobacteria bacterium]|nr:hypothetical protein [Acidobacteriota bacterium]MBI3422297.1 hypothetical protein [Acidobacteriota bacterium]